MAADKHTIKIVDKDGNQSEVTLPGFALDMTQERLIKSVQALGKLNPKMAKAYEDLIDATRETVTSNKKSSTQQKKDTKALQDAVEGSFKQTLLIVWAKTCVILLLLVVTF